MAREEALSSCAFEVPETVMIDIDGKPAMAVLPASYQVDFEQRARCDAALRQPVRPDEQARRHGTGL